MNLNLISVSKCTCTVAKTDLPVSAMQIRLSENSAPTIVVGFAASETAGGVAENKIKQIKALKPADYLAMRNVADKWCLAHEKAQFTVSIANKTAPAEDMTLTLTDWICVACGFTEFSTSGAVMFGMTLAHPAYALGGGVASIVSAGMLTPNLTSEIKLNPLDILLGFAVAFKKAEDTTKAMSQVNELAKVHEQYGQMLTLAQTQLTCNSGMPTGSIARDNYEERVKDAIMPAVSGLWSTTNIFQYITRQYLPLFNLSVKPRYNGSLYVSPLEPWGPVQYTLALTDVERMSMPPVELDPVSGIYAISEFQTGGVYSTLANSVRQFVPGGRLIAAASRLHPSVNTGTGSVARIELPFWLAGAIMNSKEVSNVDAAAAVGVGSANMDPTQRAHWAKNKFEKFRGIIAAYVTDEYLNRYRSTYSITLSLRLLLKLKGIMLYPGYVYALDMAGKSADNIRFYVTEITHTLDVASPSAGTEITGRFLRDATAKPYEGAEAEQLSTLYSGRGNRFYPKPE